MKLINTIRHIIITRSVFCFENYFPIKARNVTHKIPPALLTNSFQELYSLARSRVFHEKFKSQTYTLLGLHTQNVFGIKFRAECYATTPTFTQNTFGNLINKTFVTSFVTKSNLLYRMSYVMIGQPIVTFILQKLSTKPRSVRFALPARWDLSCPVLRDTARLSQRYPPYCALWGFWCLNMASWVRSPLPLF